MPDAASPAVAVLLATYNGEAYLAEQLESLLGQTHPNLTVLVRDDGSSDGTLALARAYRARHPERLEIVEGGRPGLGARGNFAELLAVADADYLMFCDQDDVWKPDKVELTLARMRALESEHGARTPLLVHTDLAVVDRELRLLAESFWRYQGLSPAAGNRLGRLLVQNVVTGCATMVNRALREAALPVPEEAIMHDWWLALVAAGLGRIEPVGRATLLYRQHGRNDTGAKRLDFRFALRAAGRGRDGARASLVRTQLQAGAYARRYADRLSPEALAAARAYAHIGSGGFLERRYTLLRHGLWKSGAARNLGLLLWI